MSTISTPDSLKMVREHLCLAQGRLNGYLGEQERRAGEAIGRLIADIDRQRPLGPDGTHGDRHTATCGCAVDRYDWGVAWFGADRTPGTCHRCQRAAMVHQGYNGCAAVGTFCSACKAPVLRGEK